MLIFFVHNEVEQVMELEAKRAKSSGNFIAHSFEESKGTRVKQTLQSKVT